MTQYAVIVAHSLEDCPLINKDKLDSAKKFYAETLYLARKLNVKILMDLHLNPSHEFFMLLEAPNEQAVRDLLLMRGLTTQQRVKLHTVIPLTEKLENAN